LYLTQYTGVTYLSHLYNSSFAYQTQSNSSYNLNGLQLFNTDELAINTSGNAPQTSTSSYSYSQQNGWEFKAFLSNTMEVIPDQGYYFNIPTFWAYAAFDEVIASVVGGPSGGLLSTNFIPGFDSGVNETTANTVSGETGSSLSGLLGVSSLSLDLLSAALLLAPIPGADLADLVIVPASLTLDVVSLYSDLGGETAASSYPSTLGESKTGDQTINQWEEVGGALPSTGANDPTGDRMFSQDDLVTTQVFDTSSGALPTLPLGDMNVEFSGTPGLGDNEYGWGDPIDGAFATVNYWVYPAVNIGGYVDAYPGGPVVPYSSVVLAQDCPSGNGAPTAYYDLGANNLGYWHFFGSPGCTYSVQATGTIPDQGGQMTSSWTAIPASDSSASVEGNNVTVPTVNLGAATVTFTATGLPSGDTWGVYLGGYFQSSSASSVPFIMADGSYSYTITAAPHTQAQPSTGTVSVTGSTASVAIALVPTYTVEFYELYIDPGAYWDVTLGGTTTGCYCSDIYFNETSGSYSFTLGAQSDYSMSPSSGTVTVSGATVLKAITFTATGSYTATFKESGLPSTKTWNVTLGSSTVSASAGSSISFTLVSGTLQYTVSSIIISSGTTIVYYAASPTSGTVTGATTISVTFTEKVTHLLPVGYPLAGLSSGASGFQNPQANSRALSRRS
jgi:hypothetical protein